MLECLDFGHSPGYSSCAASSHGRSAATQTWPCPPFRPCSWIPYYHRVGICRQFLDLSHEVEKQKMFLLSLLKDTFFAFIEEYVQDQTNFTNVHKMYQKASLLIIHNLRLKDAVKWHILMEKPEVKMCQAFSWNVFCTCNQVRKPAMLCCNDTLMGRNVPQWESEYILMMTLFYRLCSGSEKYLLPSYFSEQFTTDKRRTVCNAGFLTE